MASVFVSYAREDAAKAKALAHILEQACFDIWFDERLHSGCEFSEEIERELASASAVVVLWSGASIDSPWVRDEAAEGRDSGRLIPVTLDDSRPPMGFRQFQAADLSRWSGRGRPKQIEQLLAAIRAKTGAPATARAAKAMPATRQWRRTLAWPAAVLVLVMAAAVLLLVKPFGGRQAIMPSLALLPFGADSSDPDARKLAAAARDSVAHTLSHGAFAVSTIDALPQDGRAPADFLISGQMTSTPQKFIATVRMEETAHHFVVFSHQFETGRDKAENFAELIGAQVASQLSWTAPILAMERRHPSDPAITASLLQSSSAGLDSIGSLHDYETSRRLVARAPHSPLAQNTFAFSTAFALAELPRGERANAVAAARRAVDRTIELAPEYGEGNIPWCLLHSELRLVECETRLRAGMRVDPDGPFSNWFLSRLLTSVGRNREALELASLSLAHDQYMPFKISQSLRMLEISGRTDEAADLYRRAAVWWQDNPAIYWGRVSGMMLRGDFEAAARFEREIAGAADASANATAAVAASVKSNSADRARFACRDVKPDAEEAFLCMLALARVGDLDGAYRLADVIYPSRRGRTAAEEERIWLDLPFANPTAILASPAASPLRRDPPFLAVADRVGLLSYWRTGRMPDFCTIGREPICKKIASAN